MFAVHPGAVLSDIYREEWLLHTPVLGSLTKKLLSWIMRTPVEGATATVAPFANPSHFSRQDSYNDNYSNLYWRDCKPQAVNTHLVNDMWSEYLWRLSLSLLEDLGLLNGINRERLSTDP